MKRMLIALGIALGAMLLYVCRGDYLVAQLLWHDEKARFFTRENPAGSEGSATLVFPPTQTSGETYGLPIQSNARTRYFVATEYPAHLFSARQAAIDAFWYLKSMGVTRVVLKGASVGADVVKEFIRYNKAQGKSALKITSVVLMDPAWGAGELADKRAWVTRFIWWPGVLANLLSKQALGSGFSPPTPEPGVDKAALAEHHRRSKAFMLSSWGGQVRTAATPSDAKPGEFAGIPMILLRSTRDTVVTDNAALLWLAVFGVDGSHMIYVESAHCDLPAFPKAWNAGFSQAYARLPQP